VSPEIRAAQSNATVANQQTAGSNKANTPIIDPRLTTKNVVNLIIPTLQNLMTEGVERNKFGGMIRQTPVRIRELGPDLDQSILGKMMAWTHWASETFLSEDLSQPVAFGVPPPPDTPGEPTHLDNVEFFRHVQRGLGSSWNNYIGRLYESFASPVEWRMSLNEFFIALICCSKGTVGEKAMALFHLYANHQPKHQVDHMVPVTHNAVTVVEKIEGNQKKAEQHLIRAPATEEIRRTMVLHFRVFTHSMNSQDILIGEAFMPSLRPFIWSGMGQDIPQSYYIWGLEKRLPPGMVLGVGGNKGALLEEHGVRPCIGELNMAIKWMPSAEDPEQGQLGIHLYSVYFNPRYVEAVKWKNPKVTVVTYDERGEEHKIKRWDPRSAGRHIANTMTADLAYAGAYGEYLEWTETMRRDPLGGLHLRWGVGGGHGFDPKDEFWKWNHKWADQYSVEGVRFRKEFTKTNTVRPNTISIKACRLITAGILQRSLSTVTNRQAILISDQVFNRAGAVPGIIDAVLIHGDSPPNYKTLKEFMEVEAQGKKWIDIKQQMIVAWENSVSESKGSINLFSPLPTTADPAAKNKGSLAHMKVHDPFAGSPKLIWLRFVRSGDGQRFNLQVKVDSHGHFDFQEAKLDMEADSKGGKIQMSITKEEFVSCVLGSPLLSESLRKLSTTDNSTKNVPAGLPIKLDVVISDPTHEEADEDFMDAMNVRQGVLIELWDKDQLTRDDFLGECWLPPLGSIGTTPRAFILPVQNAPVEQEGNTRPDGRKDLTKRFNLHSTQCTGNLFVEAAWIFPADPPPEEKPGVEISLEERVKREIAMHTGKLHLKIIKAEGLRVADIRRKHGCDPYACVYVRNEAFMRETDKLPPGIGEGGWQIHQVPPYLHVQAFRTSYKPATVNPVWNEEKDLMLQTGSFEKRTKQSDWQLALTRRQNQRIQDQHDTAVIKDKEEIRLFFGDDDKSRTVGGRHGVKVYLGESIHQFKQKVVQACEIEAGKEDDPRVKAQFLAVADQMSFKHLVMVFVPSVRLRELAQQQRTSAHEYKRLYKVEEQDPSSWEPLETIRTFNHYAAMYGFGMQLSQRLRISEGTDDYKLRNNRYRQFEQTQKRWGQRLEETNTDGVCFGYAKYIHPRDGGSTEWRQALVYRNDGVLEMGKRKFKASFIHCPLGMLSEAPSAVGAMSEQSLREDIDEASLLLAPAAPKILGSMHLEHQEFLSKAKIFRDEGMNEQEIVQRLNAELKEKWLKAKDAEERDGKPGTITPAPATITLADVQHAIKKHDVKEEHQSGRPRGGGGPRLGGASGGASYATAAPSANPPMTGASRGGTPASGSTPPPLGPSPMGSSGSEFRGPSPLDDESAGLGFGGPTR